MTFSNTPDHFDCKNWRFIPLTQDRTPQPGQTLESNPAYWQGYPGDWEQFILEGAAKGYSIGLLVHASDLVVLDCDIRGFDENNWVIRGNTAHCEPARFQRGTEDLQRVCAENSIELPRTFTVRTRSGGTHFYFRKNPDIEIRSTGHRKNWAVDVKASPNTWVVAPPTDGYTISDDYPAAVLPYEFAAWLATGLRILPPLGGEKHRELVAHSSALKSELSIDTGDRGLMESWVRTLMEIVSLTNRYGGWNDAIYRAAHELFDVGFPLDAVKQALTEAAEPDNAAEKAKAERTIESAWDKHCREGINGFGMEGSV